MITVVIMAHKKREAQARALAEKLDCRIVWDEKNNEWDTGERALRQGKGSGWLCILQDDAIIGDNFLENLKGAVENVPTRSLISLYTGTIRPSAIKVTSAVQEARQTGATWLQSRNLLWGVGILLPTEDIPTMLKYVKYSRLPYDFRIGHYYINHAKPVYYTFPSLVDHDWQLPSLTGHGQMKRVAHYYSNDLIDWNDTVVEIK